MESESLEDSRLRRGGSGGAEDTLPWQPNPTHSFSTEMLVDYMKCLIIGSGQSGILLVVLIMDHRTLFLD